MLFSFVFALLIGQLGVIQHMESHLSADITDNCQICSIGHDMGNAMSFILPSLPDIFPQSELQVPQQHIYGFSSAVVFLARAPPSFS